MTTERAHDLKEKPRTEDVLVEDDVSFKDLLLSNSTLKGLEASGFKKPSPIQRKAIPLGRCGFDLIVQAKSGTGKTCVFTVVALEMIDTELDSLQVLILSPTREIAFQIKDVISAIGQGFEKLQVKPFIGGIPVETDKKNLRNCHIAVGAPGRIEHLISEGLMKVNAVRLFVLDEADKLMENSFRTDISSIYLKLPEVKQIIATSATFPPALEEFVTHYMNTPMRISLNAGIFLKGVRQFVTLVPQHMNSLIRMKYKVEELLRILRNVSFKQCLVFSNYQSRAESLCSRLNSENWPALYISGSQCQATRLKAMSSLKKFHCRIFISTDLSSRGIDAENVNLVVNMDLPYDAATYMHRIGRAGRYGSHGLAITILESGTEFENFEKMLFEIGGKDFQVSLFPKGTINFDIWKSEDQQFEKIWGVKGKYEFMPIKRLEKGESFRNLKKNEQLEDEEETDFSLLEKFITTYSKSPQRKNLRGLFELHEFSKEFRQRDEKRADFEENDFNYKKFSQEILNALVTIKQRDWEKFQKKLQTHQPTLNETIQSTAGINLSEAKVEIKNDNKENNNNDEGKNEDENEKIEEDEVGEKKKEEDEHECKGKEKKREKIEYEDENENENKEIHENYTDCETDSDQNNLEENAWVTTDSYFATAWYANWQAQVSAIRQYVDYVKSFQYWKQIHRS